MAALDFPPNTPFPAAPAIGDKWPSPAVPGVPVYTWDGFKWTTLGGALGSTGASDAVPAMNSPVGSGGSSTLWSRGDHSHPSDAAKVSKAGDTMTGGLIIQGNTPFLQIRKDVPPAAGNASVGGWCGTAGRWNIVLGDGAAESGGNAGSNFSINRYNDAGGNLGSALSINRATAEVAIAGNFTIASPTINLGGAAWVYSVSNSVAMYDRSGQQALIINSGSDPSNYYRNTNHYIGSAGGLANYATINANGLTLTNGLAVGANISCANVLTFNAGAQLYTDANQTTWYVNSNTCYYNYEKPTGRFIWVVNGVVQGYWNLGGDLFVGHIGYKPGGGSWGDSSDARIKNVEGDFTVGLDAISQLRPITYTFKGNDTSEAPAHVTADPEGTKDKTAPAVPYPNSPHFIVATSQKKFTGLIAQEVESVFPEMVTKRSAYVDGVAVTDLRDIDTTHLIFALVNAVKELKARIEVLEAT